MFQGLARSENSVALRIAREAGLSNVVNVAERLGVKSSLNAVPGLILGQSEVNVLEMTGAYGVFDHGGRWNRPHAIKRILDASDCENVEDLSTCRVIYDYGEDSERNQQVISPKTAETMNSLLREVLLVLAWEKRVKRELLIIMWTSGLSVIFPVATG
jgi:membrane peptidoglycan carboxypeptidase